MKKISSKLLFFYIFLFCLLYITIQGYSYGTGDQVLQIPLLENLNNSKLFNYDYIFPLISSNKTVIYSLTLLLFRYLNISFEISYLFLFCLSIYLYFFGIFRISYFLFKNLKISLLSLFIFIIPYPIAGAAIDTIETSFVPRLFANALLMNLLPFMFNKKNTIAVMLYLTIFLIHPITAVLVLPFIISWLIINYKLTKKLFIFILLALCLFIFIIYISFPNIVTLNIFEWGMDKTWLDILKLRNSYAFPLQWKFLSLIYFLILLIPLINSLYINKSIFIKYKYYQFFSIIFFISLFILLFQIIFTSLIPIPFIISLQLGRLWLIPIILSLLIFGNYLSNNLRINFSMRFIFFSLIILNIFFLISNRSNIYKKRDLSWIDAQMWIKSHTGIDCIVLVNFDSQGFRVYSQRAITGEYKDGTLSFYSKSFASEWNERRKDLSNINYLNKQQLNKLQQKYNFSLYVLNNNQLANNQNLIYKNKGYSIYKMINVNNNCQIKL